MLVLIVSLTCQAQAQGDSFMFGNWKLLNVESDTGLTFPKVDFKLQLSKDTLAYNLDVNGCFVHDFKLTKDSIIISKKLTMCTLACCDGNFDPLGKLINYTGKYVVVNDSLWITNDLITYKLERIKE